MTTQAKAKAAPKRASKFPKGKPEGYIASGSGHVDVRLSGKALDRFRELHAGLLSKNAKLENGRPIVTKLEKATKFYPAEEYHQDYYRRNPNAGYCQVVVKNKVRKAHREFGEYLKVNQKKQSK